MSMRATVTLADGRTATLEGDSREAILEAASQLGGQSQAPKSDQPPQSYGRSLGLTARIVGEGVGSLLDGALRPMAAALQSGYNAGTPASDQRRVQSPGEFIGSGMDAMGVPNPQGSAENYVNATGRAVTAAALPLGIASRLTGAIAQIMATGPGAQLLSSAGSGASSEFARQQGYSETTQAVFGLAGGIASPLLGEAVGGTYRGLSAAVKPLTASGREEMVGNLLNEQASNPAQAAARLRGDTTIVPGSEPTMGPASKDYGLLNVERGVRTANPAAYAERISAQNQARSIDLGKSVKDVAKLEARRESVTTPLRERAFTQAQGKAADSQTLVAKIDDLLAKPENAGDTSQKSLTWAKNQLAGKTDVRALYAIRKEVGGAIAGKVSQDEGYLRYAGGQLRAVNGLIDDAISAVAPSWGQYLIKYRQLSRPIERAETLTGMRDAATNTSIDPNTDLPFFSQAKWRTQVENFSQELTKGQQTRVTRIMADLDRAASVNAQAIRAPGSDTLQNATTAYVLGKAMGSEGMNPFAKTLMRPVAFLNSLTEAESQKLLMDAVLNPKTAGLLMQKATPKNMQSLSEALRIRFMGYAIGGTTGTLAGQEVTQDELP